MHEQTRQAYKERILQVLVHIQTHLDHPLPLDELAGLAHFSPYHFHRVFRGMVGEPVKEHVRRLRLERAAHRLKFSDQPITHVAFDAGFEAHESFTRAFRAMFDQSPSEFRKTHRTPPYPDVPCGVHFVPEGQLDDFQPQSMENSKMEISIERIEPMRVAFIRHTGPYDQVGATWGNLLAWAGQRGLMGPKMTMLGLCHDDPEVTPPERIRYDACLVVGDDVTPEGEVGVQEITGGDYAVVRHLGPYDKLGDTYARLCGQALPAAGREPAAGPAFEIYRNSPHDTAPQNLITDIHMPLMV